MSATNRTAAAVTSGASKPSIGWEAGRWEVLLHDRRASDERDALLAAEVGLASEIVRELVDQGAEEEDEDGSLMDMAADAAVRLGRGVYSLLYGCPERTEGGPAWTRAAAEAISGVPGIEDAAKACAGDPDMAAIAAATLLRDLTERAGSLVKRIVDEGCDAWGEPGDEDEDGAVEGVGAALARGLRGAVVEAIGEVAEARKDLDLLPGLGSSPAPQDQESPARLDLLRRLRGDARLSRILAIAGRIRRVAERVKRTRADDAREEVVDVERGADLGRVLPSELAGLRAGGVRRLLVLKGLADRSLAQYRLSGTEPLGKGPIVALLDASGSTDDLLAEGLKRFDWIAAIGIAAVRAGLDQRREVSLCTFHDRVARRWTVAAGDRVAAQAAILELASVRINPMDGTVFDPALTWALDSGAERARADLILVTDGAGIVSAPVVERVAASRERGLRVWGVLVGDGAIPGPLVAFTDGIASVDSRTPDPGAKIGELGAT